MKTVAFFASLGIIAGYFNENQTKQERDLIVGKIWQKHALDVSNENGGTYVGSVISNSLTVYNKEWGCPEGGEETVAIRGECNPNYTKVDAYKAAVIEVLSRCAQELKQSTTQVIFTEADFVYLDFRNAEA